MVGDLSDGGASGSYRAVGTGVSILSATDATKIQHKSVSTWQNAHGRADLKAQIPQILRS